MDLLLNPFHILNASPRDDRRKIMELADERSLLLESSECMAARSALTNPRRRLSAEVSWLLGIGPKRTGEVFSLLESSPIKVFAVEKLTSIAHANLLASGLSRLSDLTPNELAKWILEIAWAFENVSSEELRLIINEERVVSGFPEVADESAIESEIAALRQHYRQVIKSALDNLPVNELVEAVTIAVETATNDGEEHGPILVSDLVDSYEVEAQGFLEKEEENITTLVEDLRLALISEKSDSVIEPMVKQLMLVVRNWDTVAQPIQVNTKSLGLGHDASHRVAGTVRSLAIEMFNEYGKLDFSQQITKMLQEVFAEVVKVAERTAEDADTLDDIVIQREINTKNAQKSNEEWRTQITYEAEVGLIFKDKLRISPKGIEWKGQQYPLAEITWVRWGGTKHSVNGIPTGTTYKIVFGNNSDYAIIELRNETTYNKFIDRLWMAVCVRLFTEMLEELGNGQQYSFGPNIITDEGIELKRKKLFGTGEKVFCRWNEIEIWNGSGLFCIGKKNDHKLVTGLSFQDDKNIHILSAALSALKKRGGTRLSNLLES